MRKVTKIFTLLLMIPIFAIAQKGVEDNSKYGHGEDSIKCLRNLSISHELIRQGNSKNAIKPWRTTFNECPNASKNIYIDGVKIYKEFIEAETDPTLQSLLVDTLMMVYDQRIKYYDERGNVLGRKAIDLLRYRRDNIDDIQIGFEYLEESVNLLKGRSSAAVLATYFTAGLTLYKFDKLSREEVVNLYVKTMDLLEKAIKIDPKDKQLPEVQVVIEDNFAQSGAADCETLIRIFGAKFNENPEDIELLKKTTNLLEKASCTDSDLFEKASEKLYKLEPSSIAAYNLAKFFLKKNDIEKTMKYYNEAIEKETDLIRKAAYYYDIATLQAKQNQFSVARSNALKAIENRPDWGDPYILIGNMYVSSSSTCGQNAFEQKAVFWAAVDKYTKAKTVDPSADATATELINRYSQYFPNTEEAFFYSLSNGNGYTVGCWIGERTIVRTSK